jgi:hypothetical protein
MSMDSVIENAGRTAKRIFEDNDLNMYDTGALMTLCYSHILLGADSQFVCHIQQTLKELEHLVDLRKTVVSTGCMDGVSHRGETLN